MGEEMRKRKQILHLGYKTKPYGTGIQRSWDMVSCWLKDRDIEEFHWVEAAFVCCECGADIEYAAVPAPVTVTIYRCKRGHKFCFEFTD